MSRSDDTNKVRSNGYYRFFQGDYHKDTAGLSLVEHGAYRLLLDSYYADESLTSERIRLNAICKARTRRELKAVEYVVEKFFRQEGDRLINNRVERELKRRRSFKSIQSVRGKESASSAKRGPGGRFQPKNHPTKTTNQEEPTKTTNQEEPTKSDQRDDQPRVTNGPTNHAVAVALKATAEDLTAGAALTAAPEYQTGHQAEHKTVDELHEELTKEISRLREAVEAGRIVPRVARLNVIGKGLTPSYALDLFPDKVEAG